MKKYTSVWILSVLIIIIAGYFIFTNIYSSRKADVTGQATTTTSTPTIMSFADCASAGYPVMESYPRQCKTPDGKTYAEEIQEVISYKNASSSSIVIDLPQPGSVTGKQFKITGKARGWYFEGSFPIKVLDKDGKVLSQGPAKALSDWMTSEFVAFSYDATIPNTYTGKATVVLMKDNPSGLPENDGSASFPITIEY